MAVSTSVAQPESESSLTESSLLEANPDLYHQVVEDLESVIYLAFNISRSLRNEDHSDNESLVELHSKISKFEQLSAKLEGLPNTEKICSKLQKNSLVADLTLNMLDVCIALNKAKEASRKLTEFQEGETPSLDEKFTSEVYKDAGAKIRQYFHSAIRVLSSVSREDSTRVARAINRATDPFTEFKRFLVFPD